ncbi:unnamed protein product [Penicillium salamii]|nr:unnamed protein product [Penicillium salamii]CAG8403754.1 unnamed protein product [Penicillium salamii]
MRPSIFDQCSSDTKHEKSNLLRTSIFTLCLRALYKFRFPNRASASNLGAACRSSYIVIHRCSFSSRVNVLFSISCARIFSNTSTMTEPRMPTNPLPRASVYDWFRESKLRPAGDYGKRVGKFKVRAILYDTEPKRLFYQIDAFVDVIISDHVIREIVQRERFLKNELRTFEKIGPIVDHNKEEGYSQELANLPRQYSEAEHKLYQAETKIPGGFMRSGYDDLRQDPTWYLRTELVEDCKKKGGCCGRSCGCCLDRHEQAARNRGLGHCTPSCACCVSERGFDFAARERRRVIDDLENRMYDDDPTFVIQMIEAFFLLPPKKPHDKKQIVSNRGQKSSGNLWETLKGKTNILGAGL